jgi:5-methylcytosine-specific restriction protein A
MPRAAPRVCNRRGCNRLTDGGPRCELHPHETRRQGREADRRYDRQREQAHLRGYDATWRRLRAAVMAEEPLCRACRAEGHVTPAVDVDHITPVSVAPERRLDRANLQPLCRMHHRLKTAKERRLTFA